MHVVTETVQQLKL